MIPAINIPTRRSKKLNNPHVKLSPREMASLIDGETISILVSGQTVAVQGSMPDWDAPPEGFSEFSSRTDG